MDLSETLQFDGFESFWYCLSIILLYLDFGNYELLLFFFFFFQFQPEVSAEFLKITWNTKIIDFIYKNKKLSHYDALWCFLSTKR